MYADPLVFLLILLLGCAAFLFGLVYSVFWLMGAVGRGLVRLFGVGRENPAGRRSRPPGAGPRVCPRATCRRVEHRAARFCSQCGAHLDEGP